MDVPGLAVLFLFIQRVEDLSRKCLEANTSDIETVKMWVALMVDSGATVPMFALTELKPRWVQRLVPRRESEQGCRKVLDAIVFLRFHALAIRYPPDSFQDVLEGTVGIITCYCLSPSSPHLFNVPRDAMSQGVSASKQRSTRATGLLLFAWNLTFVFCLADTLLKMRLSLQGL